MDKITYLAELAEGLARWVPERERQDILRYYAEYFEEAGPEREAEVIAELGDPWTLSCRLAVEGSFVTAEQAAAWKPKKRRKWPWVLAGCAVLVAALIGSAFTALAAFSQSIWRNNVMGATPYVTAAVEAVYDEPADGGVYSEDEVTYVAEGAEYTGGFWCTEDGTLEQFDSIDAEISLGNIVVCEGSDFTLDVTQSVNLRGYSVQWEVKDGVLKLRDEKAVKDVEINNWKDIKNLLAGTDYTLDVTITVPEGFELEKVSAKTDLGNLVLSDLYVDQKVEAETSMGNVECYEMRTASKLDLKTSMGNVTLGIGELLNGVDIDLETSMGNVEANLNCTQEECEYELETDMGEVTVNGADRGSKAEHKGTYAYKLDAESSMGDVNVYFREDRW